MNRTIEILQHTVKYWYEEDQEMPEHEQEHVAVMITGGYNQGELNCLMYNALGKSGEWENRGWWKI